MSSNKNNNSNNDNKKIIIAEDSKLSIKLQFDTSVLSLIYKNEQCDINISAGAVLGDVIGVAQIFF